MTATNFLQGETAKIINEKGAIVGTGQINFKRDGRREIINLQGATLEPGLIVRGDDSGFQIGLFRFNEDNLVIDTFVQWDMNNTDNGAYLTLDDGSLIGVEDHFKGGTSSDYRDDYIVVLA